MFADDDGPGGVTRASRDTGVDRPHARGAAERCHRSASGFHKQNMIDYRRGRIEILDQSELRAAACSCYGIIKRQYDSFLKLGNDLGGVARAA